MFIELTIFFLKFSLTAASGDEFKPPIDTEQLEKSYEVFSHDYRVAMSRLLQDALELSNSFDKEINGLLNEVVMASCYIQNNETVKEIAEICSGNLLKNEEEQKNLKILKEKANTKDFDRLKFKELAIELILNLKTFTYDFMKNNADIKRAFDLRGSIKIKTFKGEDYSVFKEKIKNLFCYLNSKILEPILGHADVKTIEETSLTCKDVSEKIETPYISAIFETARKVYSIDRFVQDFTEILQNGRILLKCDLVLYQGEKIANFDEIVKELNLKF